jgi:hypothetical protein
MGKSKRGIEKGARMIRVSQEKRHLSRVGTCDEQNFISAPPPPPHPFLAWSICEIA